MRTPISGFRSRILILGASNVRRSLSTLVPLFLSHFPQPIDILFVCGHGRSYGHRNRVLGWSLPGIVESDWHFRWTTPDDAALYAIVTDVGNDLMYDAAPAQVFDWVRGCVDQIVAHRRFDTSQLVISGLPMERARAIRGLQFKIFRKIFFPKSSATLASILTHAESLNGLLKSHADNVPCRWIAPPHRWYGLDPIHVRRALLLEAWESIIAPWSKPLEGSNITSHDPFSAKHVGNSISRVKLTPPTRLRLIFSRAKQQSWLGFDRGQQQPSIALNNGSLISFY